jgi:hypothetical protein
VSRDNAEQGRVCPGAICLIAGVSVAVWLGLSVYWRLQNALTRVVVPGDDVLTLDEPGNYTIYHEPESVVDGQLYSAENITGLRVTVMGGDGKPVAVTAPAISSSYTIGGHSGKAVWGFQIATPGSYHLSALYPAGRTGPQTVLAIGRDVLWGIFRSIFGAIGSVMAGFAAALALVLTTYFRRQRIQRAAMR